MPVSNLSDAGRGIIFIWIVLLFILELYNLIRSIQVKRKSHIVISVLLLVIGYFTLQVLSDIINGHVGSAGAMINKKLGQINVIWWVMFIGINTVISATLVSYFNHWKEEHITPMSVKDSIDMLHAGLCYWEEGGRIILTNKKMDELCLAITGQNLLNGEQFFQAIESDCIVMPDGSIQCFLHNQVSFNDKQINELVAADVTELYKKNEMLEQKTEVLKKMNESLRRYNQNIEETVRKQEILDTKVYIHDEMNRLMLVTTANAETPVSEEEFISILTLWRNNAILLGNETEKVMANTDISEINRLADLLGVQLRWKGEQPGMVPDAIREVFIMVAGEALANAVKHAEAKNITFSIQKNDTVLTIKISNDGILPKEKINLGGGLTNIKRMVEAKRGRFRVEVNECFNMILEFDGFQ